MRWFVTCIGLAALLIGSLAHQAGAEGLYFTDRWWIYRAGLDGSGVTEIHAGFADGIALDMDGKKIYFTGDLPIAGLVPSGRVWRADLDGSNFQTLVESWTAPVGIALELPPGNIAADKMYWTDSATIQRADLEGTRQETLVKGQTSAFGIALDGVAGKMYWTRGVYEKSAAVRRASLDGSGVEDLILEHDGPATGIALDSAGGKMYFAYVNPYLDSLYAGFIERANLDGSGVETIVAGLYRPTGIALDPEHGKVYWADTSPAGGVGAILRSNFDGTGREVVVSGLVNPRWIALDVVIPEPGALLGGCLAAVALLHRRRAH